MINQDIKNRTFGRLIVVKYVKQNKHRQALWECRCICGNTVVVSRRQLVRKTHNTKSCGCLKSEQSKLQGKKNSTHGMSHAPEYHAWDNMKRRCYNKNYQDYANYGGRGIRVCDAWLNSFSAFYENVGPRPSTAHSLERTDVNKDYEPGNVRWATQKEQTASRRKFQTLDKFSTQELIDELARRN